MKSRTIAWKAVILGFLLISQSVFASSTGPYLGLQLGWGKLNQGEFIASSLDKLVSKTFPDTSVSSVFFSDTGRGGRIFLGYQFNPYVAVEGGYYRFSSLKLNADLSTNITVLEQFHYNLDVPLNLSTRVEVRTDAFDLVAKGIWPVTQKFSLYAKAGLAALNSDGKAIITLKTPVADFSLVTDPSVNIVYPTFGLGMNYDITPQVSGDLAWNRIQKVNPCPYPSIDFVSAGLIYHFY